MAVSSRKTPSVRREGLAWRVLRADEHASTPDDRLVTCLSDPTWPTRFSALLAMFLMLEPTVEVA
jgi:hypothetical protein